MPKNNPGEGAALPRPTFFNSALVVGLFVVELVVAGVSAPGSGCDHGTGLPRGVVTWAFRRGGQGEKRDKKRALPAQKAAGEDQHHTASATGGLQLPKQQDHL